MKTHRPRLRSNHVRGLLILGAFLAAPACSNDDASSWMDDPALRGATVGEVETLVFDKTDGTSERQHFLNVGGPDGARLRLHFPADRAPQWTNGDRVGVWGDRLAEDFMVSREILMPEPETSITSALIGAPAKPRTAVFVIVDVG